MFLFFVLDHFYYSRWGSVHIRVMKTLPITILNRLNQNWVVNKNNHRFSNIPIDQTHEQENAKVKQKGGAVGLTENPDGFRRWMISGPEEAWLITIFENLYLSNVEEEINYHHHERGLASQRLFQQQVKIILKL